MMNAMPPGVETRRAISGLLRTVEHFRQLDPEMQAQTMATFLQIALNEGISQRDLVARVGTSTSSVSRNVSALSSVHHKGQSGHALIATQEDPMDRRSKMHFLTPKGRAFLNLLKGAP